MSTRNNDPTDGRVYGGDTGLIHIEDGRRGQMGSRLAELLDSAMRDGAVAAGRRRKAQAEAQSLCPGCYMVALFNCAVDLAVKNHQSLAELGDSMSLAFKMLADAARNGEVVQMESIIVVLDSHDNEQVIENVFGAAAWTL